MAKPTIQNWHTLKMPVRLSGRDLWAYRYFLPLFLGIFPLGMFAAAVIHREIVPFLLGAILFGVVSFIIVRIWQWKEVYADETHLEVRSFSRRVRIPYSQIQCVEENNWDLNTRVTTIRFTTPCGFGDSIRYVPYFRWFPRYSYDVWWDLARHPANALIEHLSYIARENEKESMIVSM